ncbi:hypothetical protein [Microbacterium sp. NPDC055683]
MNDDELRPSWWRAISRPGLDLSLTVALVIWLVVLMMWAVNVPAWSGALTAIALLGAFIYSAWMRRRHGTG